ncbi:putative immunoglobulin-blocking virulence protein [Mycoplasmopsis cricetuli]|uniref:putative immunoglobulin-blocking virulence protein n=1 Tax=Mycoplasmopsis cricetuli TaxID=171283 RepID=UPI00146F9AE9|nr:putative immunoglobulin-blocking virulence protein [Mycoplasmopsis cricetuli]
MLFKKISRKNKKVLFILSTAISSSILSGSLIYIATTNSENSIERIGLLKDNLIGLQFEKNLDLTNAVNSNSDKNLKPKESELISKKQIEVEKPIIINQTKDSELISKKTPEQSIITDQSKNLEPTLENKPIIKKPKILISNPIPKSANPTKKTQKNESKPTEKVKTNIIKIKFHGIDVDVLTEELPQRISSNYDIENKIVNRIPYLAQIVPKLKGITVTDKIRKANQKSATTAFKARIFGGNLAHENIFREDIKKFKEFTDEKLKNFLDHVTSRDWNGVVFDKFRLLILHGKDEIIKKYLTPEGIKEWPKLKEIKDERIKIARTLPYIDFDKFTVTSSNVETQLGKGFVLEPDNYNIYINENGEIDSYSFSPLINGTVVSIQRDNSEKRVFGFDSDALDFKRYSPDLIKGTYKGWTKTNITSEYHSYGITQDDGITISSLKKDTPINGKRNHGIVVEVDFANVNGFNKLKKFIEDINNDKKEITSYRFLNMGKKDANQQFKDILEVLPEKLPQLELFFETKNTSALIALENKKIDEIGIFTTMNSISDDWALNPLALRNVAWVNTIDYNVGEYQQNSKVASRITFNNLAFEESDVLKRPDGTFDLKRINDGLRMAYYVRNNEKIFQGSLGPGLNPDHNEGGNSYPLGIDLSRVPSLKTLRGLVFNDTQKSSNKSRKLKRIVLFNDSEVWKVDADELNNANFNVLSTEGFQSPRSKILFSNGSETKKIRIFIKNNINLNSSGLANLSILLNWSESGFRGKEQTEILVSNNDSQLATQLEKNGYKVVISQEASDSNTFI